MKTTADIPKSWCYLRRHDPEREEGTVRHIQAVGLALAARGASEIRIRACLQAWRKCRLMRAFLGAEVGDWTFTTGC